MLLTATAQTEVRLTTEDLVSLPQDYRTFEDLLHQKASENVSAGLLEAPQGLEVDRVLHWRILGTEPSAVDTSNDIVVHVEVRMSR